MKGLSTWIWVIGGVLIAFIVFSFFLKVFSDMTIEKHRQSTMESFDFLVSDINSFCGRFGLDQITKTVSFSELTSSLYSSGDGNYLCINFRDNIECQPLACSVELTSDVEQKTLLTLINRISGRIGFSEYRITIYKVGDEVRMDVVGIEVTTTTVTSTTTTLAPGMTTTSSTLSPGATTTTSTSGTTTTFGGGTCLSGSPCQNGWPSHEGGLREINEIFFSCDVFEVCDSGLKQIADNVRDCCNNGCSGSCHGRCDDARSLAGITSAPETNEDKIKKCSAYYLAFGLGSEKSWMEDYYYPELYCCIGIEDLASCDDTSFNCGEISDGPHTFTYPNARDLKCKGPGGNPIGWIDDNDMSKNNCIMSDLPAHASVNKIKTGICADYSIAYTTLARLVGFSKDDVFTSLGAFTPSGCNPTDCENNINPQICCTGHAWNIIKLPGDSKWLMIDTTGNRGGSFNIGNLPGGNYDYCDAIGKYYDEDLGSDGCVNDAKKMTCPSTNDIYGC
ncbi:MAG: hypothetical protein ISS48_04330 [Candidatus Aenigmarchaeota archaeon]|nr:hypothetical protein [Candidatus Aenigmarchaeota archaeon]